MKYFITRPRLLKSGKRVPYWGCRITTESSHEAQALRQLYPLMGKAPKGRRTQGETETWLSQVRAAVERRAHLLSMGLPVGDTVSYDERVEEYIAWGKLQGGKKNLPWGEGHAEHIRTYLTYWKAQLGLQTLSDVHQGSFNQGVARLAKSFAGNTVNNKAFALTGLCSWAHRTGYLPGAPITFSALDDTPINPRGAFTLDELRILFQGSPWARSIVYRTAYHLRFRRNECSSLKIKSILWADGLMDLHYLSAKDREQARKPIPRQLLKDLWGHCAGRDPEERLFEGWSKKKAAENLHRDMERLGIPLYLDGKRRDFHSLGHSTATSIDRHKVAPGLASKFMRHKDWAETMGYQNHEVEAERVVSQALEDEVKHTDDTLEEKMLLKSDLAGSYVAVTSSPSPSAPGGAAAKSAAKITKFRRFPRSERKAPVITLEKYEALAAHLRHALFASGTAADIEAFLKLTPKQQAEAVKASGRKAGAA